MAERRFEVREAQESDAAGIREIFLASYGRFYSSPYYDLQLLKKMIFSDDMLTLVVDDPESGELVGTASVILEIGAYSDLVGEFGRLAVHPNSRRQGIGKLLLEARLERVRRRLHLALMEARCVHDFSQRTAEGYGFSAVGFLPLKLLFGERESAAVMIQHLENSLSLRRNNPRVVPEIYPLAASVMDNLCLPLDLIVDEDSPAYPKIDEDFRLDELTAEGYSSLLRIERGRVRRREIFGPMRLHYGFFQLSASHCCYLLARDSHSHIAGAVGFMIDNVEKTVRVFELISLNDHVVRFLLRRLEEKCFGELGTEYIEIDIGAYSAQMQRTLLELNYIAGAYIPAMVFHRVERLDVVKMFKLRTPPVSLDVHLRPANRRIAEIVMGSLHTRAVLPQIDQAVQNISLFSGLSDEQAKRLACVFEAKNFAEGSVVFSADERADHFYILLEGSARITVEGREVGRVNPGECLGEIAFLSDSPHSAQAHAITPVEAAALSRDRLRRLIRKRPDIATVIYRNLAVGLGRKLRRADHLLAGNPPKS